MSWNKAQVRDILVRLTFGLVFLALFIVGIIKIPGRMTAITAMFVVVAAIWGNWIRSLLAGPKLRILLEKPKRYFGAEGDTVSYQLVVRNDRPLSPAVDVKVVCTGLWKMGPEDDHWKPLELKAPVQLEWTVPYFVPTKLVTKRLCNLGNVYLERKYFLQKYHYDFDWLNSDMKSLRTGEAMRWRLFITAENFISKRQYVLEASLADDWPENSRDMREPLVIKGPTLERKEGER